MAAGQLDRLDHEPEADRTVSLAAVAVLLVFYLMLFLESFSHFFKSNVDFISDHLVDIFAYVIIYKKKI